MDIRTLTLPEIRHIYKTRLVNDFPLNEQKPLAIIEAAYKKGRYVCYGLQDGAETAAYAFFVTVGRQYMLDYLAVSREKRGTGIGSAFLGELCRSLRDADCAILESDDPAYAEDEAEKALRERRLRFYRKNGLRDTGVRANVFGADFVILEMPIGQEHDAGAVRDMYAKVYAAMLPAKMYAREVHIR